MKRILIVNLTRFGDLLQTSPTIVGVKEQYPDAHLTVLMERNFAAVCEGIPGIDRVYPLDLDQLGRLIIAKNLREAYRFVEALVQDLRAQQFDLVLNYSSSRMSAVLLGLVNVPDTRGWTMTADGHRLISSQWSRLFSASCLSRRQAALNLVDFYKRIAGVTKGPQRIFYQVSEAARGRVRDKLVEAGHAGEPLIGIQLGASREARRWPVESCVALGRLLHERLGARMVLCGGGGDRPFAEEVSAQLGPIALDLCGRTSIADLGALLERCDVLVTPDTGPMHMAIAVGTPVVALFFGPALPFDTGPYLADQLCLHADVSCAPCDHNVTCLEPFCRETLAPALVADAVVARRAGDWAALRAAADRWSAVRWYRTCFDVEGLFDVEHLGTRPPKRMEQLRRVYRQFWKTVLEGAPIVLADTPLRPEADLARELAALATEALVAGRAAGGLARSGLGLELVEDATRRLEEADFRLFKFGAMHEPTTLLVQTFRFEKENIQGDDIAALATTTRVLHEELEARVRLLVDMLDPPRASLTVEGGQHASIN